ncbi:hypothetical protein NDU88_004012 [Pleurodeles waltl]|uniref:Tubulin-specific chaperone A n=1 Tax=Pleurodeles waltl TaxID=8319 RepID=A0AAV7V2A7_PLEWA|nr:hypothetical protein NDU88_004012 [Pleurodeles waltl]
MEKFPPTAFTSQHRLPTVIFLPPKTITASPCYPTSVRHTHTALSRTGSVFCQDTTDMAADFKVIRKEMGVIGQRVTALKRTGDFHEEELEAQRREVLDVKDKKD